MKKNGKEISIDKLSTGESQIIFRGTHLLKNVGILEGSVIFIDEPEMSMHPRWQQKILSYYKNLFKAKAQLIIATHSQGVIREALEDSEHTKVIVLRDANGVVQYGEIDKPLVLSPASDAEINYQAFGIASTDYHNALYGYIEAEGKISEYKELQKREVCYNKIEKDGSIKEYKICLSEKLRNMIHHPENTHNGKYNEEDIRISIDDMRNYILSDWQTIELT